MKASLVWTGIAGLGLAGATAFVFRPKPERPEAPEALAQPTSAASKPEASPEKTSTPDAPSWVAALQTSECAAECVGGVFCKASLVEKFRSCPSGIRCIEGREDSLVEADAKFHLHLSAIAEVDVEPADPCASGRDLWLCARSSGSDTTAFRCVSQKNACSHGGPGGAREPAGIPVSGAELTRDGLELEVRLGGIDGEVVGREAAFRFPGGVLRKSLCHGLRAKFTNSKVKWVSFFLDETKGEVAAESRVEPRAVDAPIELFDGLRITTKKREDKEGKWCSGSWSWPSLEGKESPGIAKLEAAFAKGKNEKLENCKEATEDGRYEFATSFSVGGVAAPYFSICLSSYGYLGGAHGGTGEDCLIANTESGALVSLASTLDQPALDRLSALVLSAFRKENKVEKLSEAGFFEDEFKVSAKTSIAFTKEKTFEVSFAEYEVGPYAMGHPTATISAKDFRTVCGKSELCLALTK